MWKRYHRIFVYDITEIESCLHEVVIISISQFYVDDCY